MIEHHWYREHQVLEMQPRDPLSREDFAILAGQVNPVLVTHGRLLGLLIDTGHFRHWDQFAEMLDYCRFTRDQHRHIHKVAVIADRSLLAFMPQLVNHFVGAEVRPFAVDERREALEWLGAPG
ncbi:STAS/SEC14 domain-containing protein [Microbulbifer sp. SAOS-129_SWC]|uniref:STAS/SEC14 domain-containing protein n=1 Tax=Microbulbifer sp. SAOS-129_SWC TaxID=3145235 RepID=UPI00321760B2